MQARPCAPLKGACICKHTLIRTRSKAGAYASTRLHAFKRPPLHQRPWVRRQELVMQARAYARRREGRADASTPLHAFERPPFNHLDMNETGVGGRGGQVSTSMEIEAQGRSKRKSVSDLADTSCTYALAHALAVNSKNVRTRRDSYKQVGASSRRVIQGRAPSFRARAGEP